MRQRRSPKRKHTWPRLLSETVRQRFSQLVISGKSLPDTAAVGWSGKSEVRSPAASCEIRLESGAGIRIAASGRWVLSAIRKSAWTESRKKRGTPSITLNDIRGQQRLRDEKLFLSRRRMLTYSPLSFRNEDNRFFHEAWQLAVERDLLEPSQTGGPPRESRPHLDSVRLPPLINSKKWPAS